MSQKPKAKHIAEKSELQLRAERMDERRKQAIPVQVSSQRQAPTTGGVSGQSASKSVSDGGPVAPPFDGEKHRREVEASGNAQIENVRDLDRRVGQDRAARTQEILAGEAKYKMGLRQDNERVETATRQSAAEVDAKVRSGFRR